MLVPSDLVEKVPYAIESKSRLCFRAGTQHRCTYIVTMKHIAGADAVAYDESGQGPAILSIHAGIADRRMWSHQFAEFAPDYRVIRMDLRGFGESARPTEPYANYEDARGLLAALGVERAIVVG